MYTRNELLNYVDSLANGVDPKTGELLDKDTILNRPDVIRMLYSLKEYISEYGPKITKLDKNRSYQAMNYGEKRKYYLQNNIIAQSFHEDCYKKNPRFINFATANNYSFKAYPTFGKKEILERQQLYQDMANNIWKSGKLKEIESNFSNDFKLDTNE